VLNNSIFSEEIFWSLQSNDQKKDQDNDDQDVKKIVTEAIKDIMGA